MAVALDKWLGKFVDSELCCVPAVDQDGRSRTIDKGKQGTIRALIITVYWFVYSNTSVLCYLLMLAR